MRKIMTTAYVYLITNLVTNKHYIGKTKNKSVRWSQHKSKAKNSKDNNYFINAIKKYGKENFIFEIIKECSSENDAFEYEKILIKLFDLQNKKFGYNTADGGETGSKGFKVKENTKEYFKKKYQGAGSSRAKFSNDEVLMILKKYYTETFSVFELSKIYKCSKTTMNRIIRGQSYANVEYNRSSFDSIVKSNKKRKAPQGSKVKTSKLSELQVIEIKELHKTGNYNYSQIGKLFNVTKTNIGYIVKGMSRKNG